MDHNQRGYSAEEVVMAVCLLLSTAISSISSLIDLRPLFDPDVIRIDLTAAPVAPLAKRRAGAVNDPAVTGSQETGGSAAEGDPIADMDFALAELSRSEGTARPGGGTELRMNKDIYVSGKRAGSLEITVTAAGDLIVDGGQLKALLQRPDFERQGILMGKLGNGPVSFETLRERGIDFRYAPEDDVFRING